MTHNPRFTALKGQYLKTVQVTVERKYGTSFDDIE